MMRLPCRAEHPCREPKGAPHGAPQRSNTWQSANPAISGIVTFGTSLDPRDIQGTALVAAANERHAAGTRKDHYSVAVRITARAAGMGGTRKVDRECGHSGSKRRKSDNMLHGNVSIR